MAECHPVGFQWVMEAQGARRDDHPRRSAVHPHERGRRHPRAAPRRQRHRVPRRHRQLHHRERSLLPRLRRALHERAGDRERRLPRHRRPRRAVQRLGRRDAVRTTRRRGRTKASTSRPPRASARSSPTEPDSARGTAARRVHFDPTLEHPRCVFQVVKRHFSRYTPEMVEEVCGVPRELFLAGRRGAVRQLGPRSHVRVLLRGRLDAAHDRRAVHPHRVDRPAAARQHRPSRAAGSSRCAVTRRSRARPTCRRCTTCCPATCRCRRRRSTRRSTSTSTNNGSNSGWWSEFPKYAVSLLKAWWGDNATADNDWCYDHLPRLTGDHSHMVDGRRHGRRQGAAATS